MVHNGTHTYNTHRPTSHNNITSGTQVILFDQNLTTIYQIITRGVITEVFVQGNHAFQNVIFFWEI